MPRKFRYSLPKNLARTKNLTRPQQLTVSIPIENYECAPATSLQVLKQKSKRILLQNGWQDISNSDESMIFALLENNTSSGPNVAMSITVTESFNWLLHVNGRLLSKEVECLSADIAPVSLKSVSSVRSLLSYLNKCKICSGNSDPKFLHLAKERNGKFTDVTGKIIVATCDAATVRSTNCPLLFMSSGIRCLSCTKQRKVLTSLLHRQNKRKTIENCLPSSSTTYNSLTASEMKMRLQNLHHSLRTSQNKVSYLESKLEKVLNGERSVLIDDEHLNEELLSIAKSVELMQVLSSSFEAGSFPRIFWEQQNKALNLKSTKSMRWDPLMIRFCLYLRHLSNKSYNLLRDSEVLTLPSLKTLRDYTYYTKATSGFSDDVDEQLRTMAKVDKCMERDKYVAILMDEMKIQADLAYDKYTGSLVGFTNLGDINNHLTDFENSLKEDKPISVPLATSMLVLMIRGLCNNFSFPYAQFPCNEVSGFQLYDIFWEAVGRLELCGFKVMALVCDGLSANRRLFKISSSSDNTPYKVKNPYSDSKRYIFFISDPPHLIKTTRNAWANEKRNLWCNGKSISWDHLTTLYQKNRSEMGLSLIPKLKYEHIHLTTFSKMRVDLATQVLSSSVSKALTLFIGEEAMETAKFTEMFDKFFDCLNVSNFSEGKHSRNYFKTPYYSANDFRLKWLKEDFLKYLEEWERSVMERQNFTKNERNQMLLSKETREGIKITVNAFVELVEFMFTVPEVTVFLSQKLCQDPLENFFGIQRQRGRGHENPNVKEFIKNTQALRVINGMCKNVVNGNCRGQKENDIYDSAPLPKRKYLHK